jgi:hypothetical protein
MIALVIAAGVETNNFPPPQIAIQLRQAFSIIYVVAVAINLVQYIRMWMVLSPTEDIMFICATVGVVIVFIESWYIVASAFVINISTGNYLIPVGWYVGGSFIPLFLASIAFIASGTLSPKVQRRGRKRSLVPGRKNDGEYAQEMYTA